MKASMPMLLMRFFTLTTAGQNEYINQEKISLSQALFHRWILEEESKQARVSKWMRTIQTEKK